MTNKTMQKIGLKHLSNGFEVSFKNKSYSLNYPQKYWDSLNPEMKSFFSENMAYLATMHLNQMQNINTLSYNFQNPWFASYFYRVFYKHAPFSADSAKLSTVDFLREFTNSNHEFEYAEEYTIPRVEESRPKSDAIINFTLGKDSLLTTAVANELKMDYELSFMASADYPREYEYRKPMFKKYTKEFGNEIIILNDTIAKLHHIKYWQLKYNEWNIGYLITYYAMSQIPIINKHKAKYLFFGNENDCSLSYINKEGFKSYPVYDQTAEWTIELKKMLGLLTTTRCSVVSLMEPLNDLGIMQILHHRYPKMGKYQMSCFPDESRKGKLNYWCHHCPKCANIFILSKAIGIDPRTFNLNDDMFQQKYKSFFSCFESTRTPAAFDQKIVEKEEQLFAFYLAYKKGASGYLINLFKKRYLDYVKEREDELFKKYFTVRKSVTIPTKLKNQVLSIYKEELDKVSI